MIIAELKTETGDTITKISAPEKVFKTGSRGYYGMAKAEIGGKRYQIQLQIVEIGSKPQNTDQ